MKNKELSIQNWALIGYQKAWDQQEELFNAIKKLKEDALSAKKEAVTPNYVIFCEHPHVYTLGKLGNTDQLLINEAHLKKKGIDFVATNRGGSITYHGPGQLVVYLILDLENFSRDVSGYLRILEQAVVATLGDFNLAGKTLPGLTGVWMGPENKEAKICAIGIRLAKWITMHGLALNVTTDLTYFEHIVPCGLVGSQVTSMERLLGYRPTLDTVAQRLLAHLQTKLSQWNA